MQTVYLEDYGFVPDIIGTSCANSIKLKDLDFRVPCGKCLPCQKKRRSEWSLRLEHEYMFSDSAFFITLTYDEINVPRTKEGFKTLNKKHLQNYIKRLRNDHVKYVSKELNIPKSKVKEVSKPIRYYAIGEYGEKTRRPHYHALIFNMEVGNLSPFTNQWKNTETGYKFGHVDVGTVTGASINYVTKYMFKPFGKKDKREKPFSIMSKGRKNTPYGIIGHAYLDHYGVHHITSESLEVRDKKGNARRLPKAYLRRLFTNKEDRLELSRRSFEQHIEKKIKEYENTIVEHYSGKVLDYQNSIEADLNRHRNTINNTETL